MTEQFPAHPMAAPSVSAPSAVPRIVDMTHSLFEGFPVWPGDPAFTMRPAGDEDSRAEEGPVGFAAHVLRFGEHTGTHIDAPAHVVPEGMTVDRIPVSALMAPLAVVDIRDRALHEPDTTLTVEDIARWEADHGPVPPRALVSLHSGWAGRIERPEELSGIDADGVMHFPGWSGEAIEFLIAERDIVAIGTDALSIDSGRSTDFPAHQAILGSGRYAVELLARLDDLPAAGATVVVAPIKHRGGTGGPARVLALIGPGAPAVDADAR